jgi:iron complex transport system substrate-binding protein
MKRYPFMRVCLFSAVLAGLLVGLTACGYSSTMRVGQEGKPLYSMQLTHATGFSVDYFEGYKRVIVHSPWVEGEEIARYYLTTDSTQETPSDGHRILIPVRSLVAASSTHYAFLELLGELDKVVGLCEAKRVYNPVLRAGCATGRIVDLGDPFRMNVERCLLLKPELVMVSGFNQYDEHVNRLMAAGMSVVYNNEWMEADVLGRAEWVRYIACFFDKEALADSLFALTAQRYEHLKKIGATVKGVKPLVLSGDNFRGTWRSQFYGLFVCGCWRSIPLYQ